MPSVRTALTSAVVGIALALSATLPAQAAGSTPTITKVTPVACQQYQYEGWWTWNSCLRVTVHDPAPFPEYSYVEGIAKNSKGKVVDKMSACGIATFSKKARVATYDLYWCGDIPPAGKMSLTVKVTNATVTASRTTKPFAFTFKRVAHANHLVIKHTPTVGAPTQLAWKGGHWGKGTRFTSMMWTSKTKDFTDDDYAANAKHGAALVSRRTGSKPILTFTPRQRDFGRYVWITVLATRPGYSPWGYQLAPVQVGAGTIADHLVTGTAQASGAATVGSILTATPAPITPAGTAANLTVAYIWQVDGATVDGATTNQYTPSSDDVAKTISAKVTYTATGYTPVVTTVTWPAVTDPSQATNPN